MKYLDPSADHFLPPLLNRNWSRAICSVLFCFFLLCHHLPTWAQGKIVLVKGNITSQSGEPLSGVSIQSKETGKGTNSGQDGNFQIDVPPNSTLRVSYIGYITKEIRIGSTVGSNLSIQLMTNKNELDQVVVVGYGTRRKSDITGAITSISEQSIKDVPASNLASALQGQGAGIDIQRSGANSKPGATPNILIRGSRSLGASNAPLIVVDGIPFNGSINDLNQDDVSSVEVLKDASSTAIYGSRGANGVILVSTKRGRTGKPVLTYSGYMGETRLIREFPVMNAQEFTNLKKWAHINGNPGKYTGLDDPQFLTGGVFDPAEVEGLRIGRNTNWQSYIYKTGIMTNHQLGITGGSESTQFALSGGYFNQTGIYQGQGFERFTVKASIDQQLGKFVKVGLSSLNTFTVRKGESANPMAQALRASPLVSPFDSAGNVLNDFIPGSASQVWNPLADLLPGAVVEDRKRFGTFTTLYLDLSLAKGLKYRFNTGVEIRNDVYGNYFAGKTTFRVNQGGSASSNRTNFNTNFTLENLLTYDKVFLTKHKLNFTGLFSLQESKTQSNQFDNTNIAADYLAYYNPTYASNLRGSGSYAKWDILSYMGRLNYTYNDKYLLTLTMRSDGSSRLAPGNKYHLFPSAAAAWNISKEAFFDRLTGINNLKLRASYGTTGNTAINPYQTLGALSPLVYNYGQTTVTGAYLSNASNEQLTWEYTSTANVGLDFGFLNNRVSGSVELYKQYTNSLLLPQTLPITSGIPNAVVKNIGKTENKGIEFHVSTINIQGRTKNDFSWSTDLNFFINRGKITQLAAGVTRDVSNGWFIGQPIDVYYDYKRMGIWQNTPADSAEARRLGLTVTGSASVIGTIRVADVSGPKGEPDGKIDATYDRVIVGTSQPKWEGGMTNRLGYRGFDFTVVAFARIGSTLNSSLEGGNFVNTYQGTYNNLKTDYWTPFNNQNSFPKPNSAATNPLNRSVLSYFDGSFVKIRSISLGYNLPPTLVQRMGGRSVRIYATASDPFILFSPYRKQGGIDPEGAGTVGIDTPPVWSMLFGINVSF
ncbi:TonB-dependent receptor [Segetibacter sp. 3557_3]|uniref:SusC/RagA family TonB-linked outer membrane protein n=1 Tax=Segetibacter sp. 3557_3 TaxID=2547429 RepID=UPI001058FB0C|nr:TonB-dependent receptor [Segetibacter sp. 3557_3]TDH20069.1 TonB-dependent receptor [Segetibacter sp. 3557_3]